MNFRRRVWTVYRKELTDILRDRRTLTAMVLVPIVLYPLLMIGSIQAVTYQAEALQEDRVVIGVVGEAQQDVLVGIIMEDAGELARRQVEMERNPVQPPRPSIALDKANLRNFDSLDSLQEAIRQRQVHVGVTFAADALIDRYDVQNAVVIHQDKEEVRSATAGARIADLFARVNKRTQERRLIREGLPAQLAEPFLLSRIDLSAPPSVLGQILPLVLVLMTITGAIYPAIDLTAGERERGTLESLMVTPVPVLDLIVGKFLVVTTIAILGAALNLASVSATVYFGGFQKIIATAEGSVPLAKMFFILLALIPFAVLMSAIMIAVCSFARTFKEAQNYVTPVIFAVLIPGGFAALPATRLEGIMLVMPVGNMVLLARDVLLGAVVPLGHVALVLFSTTLYAAAAVALAAGLFGQEAVLFADVGSLRTLLGRRFRKPAPRPSVSTSLMIVALLFPVWFFVQGALSPREGESMAGQLIGTGLYMPLLFVLLPLGLAAYSRLDFRGTFAWRAPAIRHWIAALLLGVSAWVPAYELNVLQQSVLPIPAPILEGLVKLQEAIRELPPRDGLLYLAVIPAVCEELLFRGVLLSGLAARVRPLGAVLASAAIFGVYHFVAVKFVPTFALGILLGYLCLRSGSVLPGMLVHALHNGLSITTVYWPWQENLGVVDGGTSSHLPPLPLIGGLMLFVAGIAMVGPPPRSRVTV
jgi:ABC-2 type transport system permease protein/sodium transport system permease protein